MLERNYKQNCALARASDLLGERWTLLIVRDLLIAPRRFVDLEQRLKGIGTNLLAKRLKDMRSVGLIAGGEARSPYRLTHMGQALEPMVLQLVRWSLNWVRGTSTADTLHFPDWDLLALKSLFVPDQKMRKPLLVRLHANDWRAWIRIDRECYVFGLGEPEATPDIIFPCTIPALRTPDRILSEMNPKMRDKAHRFLACFPMV
jgi:DNA-binding HxlR family transcriptional regulator